MLSVGIAVDAVLAAAGTELMAIDAVLAAAEHVPPTGLHPVPQ